MNKKDGTPVYLQLVKFIRTGFLALDESVQNEIKTFVKSQQNTTGGFADRAGKSDLYYSLFGLWLSLATEQTELQNELKKFVSNINEVQSKSPVEDLALLLISAQLDSAPKKQSVFTIIRKVLKKGRMIELSYQFFLISLVVDAVGRNTKLYYFIAKVWLLFYWPKGSVPCSLTAALVYARKILGLKTKNRQKELVGFSVESGGFRIFEALERADILSTGVALFVLKEIGYDLRILAPACLDFVQQNYAEGAFLSGDGDLTKDLEYTFYGLLALGSLVKD